MADHAQPFHSGAEAWFWFCASQRARDDGAIERAGLAEYSRPCDPVDIGLAVTRLHKSGRLRQSHLRVLFSWGRELMSPPAHKRAEVELWHDALAALERELKARGIVA